MPAGEESSEPRVKHQEGGVVVGAKRIGTDVNAINASPEVNTTDAGTVDAEVLAEEGTKRADSINAVLRWAARALCIQAENPWQYGQRSV